MTQRPFRGPTGADGRPAPRLRRWRTRGPWSWALALCVLVVYPATSLIARPRRELPGDVSGSAA